MNFARRQDGAETSPGRDAAGTGLPAFGIATAVSLTLGVLLAMRLPALPAWWACIAAVSIGVVLWWRSSRAMWRCLGAFVFGIGWSCLAGHDALEQRLPAQLEGEDLTVRGRVVGLPESRGAFQRFEIRVASGEGEAAALAGTRLRLSWYGRTQAIEPGEEWRLSVRLRRPRGVLNPGGFDFERHALERRIVATGYVRESPDNARLSRGTGLEAWRDRLSTRLARESSSPAMRFVRALALGDTRGFAADDWEALRATGLGHLFAISGFHIGIVAGFAALLAGVLYRSFPGLGLRLPRPQGAALAALTAALGYAAAAGFSLPTQRALLMVGAVLLAQLLRRTRSTSQAFALAAIALLLVDPLAVLGAGFWLSFLGVGWLLWCLPRDSASSYLRTIATAQGVVTLGLLPLTVWFFGQASLVGPLLNLVAIPAVTLLIVPLALLGVALEAVWSGLGASPLWLATQAMEFGWEAADHVAGVPWARVWLPEPTLLTLGLAGAGVFWCLMPRGTPARWLGLVLCLPMFWPARPTLADGEIELGVIDVGQGLAAVVRTARHVLVYDSGPAYDGGLDLGDAAVVPALHAQGIGRIDALVLSHGDSDHAGGRHAVLRAFAPDLRLAPAGWAETADFDACERGDGWSWDGVRFDVLHPPRHFPYLGNDASCVLRISGRFGSVLLPGDIGDAVEARLVREMPGTLAADVLVVPHHGSRTSSSANFVAAVSPAIAIYAIGHRNRFGFPRADVLDRYAAAGALQDDTAASGHLRIRLDRDGVRIAERRRQSHRRFWHEAAD